MKAKTRFGLFSSSSPVCLAHTRSYLSCLLCGQALSLPCTVWHGLDLLSFLPYRFSCFIERMPNKIRHSCRASTEAQIPSIRRCRIIHPSSRKQPHCSRSSLPLYRRRHRPRLLRRKQFTAHSEALLWTAIPCSARNAVQD